MKANEFSSPALSERPLVSFGALLEAPDRTNFRVWAPNVKRAEVVLNGVESFSMKSLGGGWFDALVHCEAGTRYLFRFDGEIEVPDPASRAQEGDAHGASLVVDPHSYEWRDTAWRGLPWEHAVFYELHVGACGGFKGVMERLPALAKLGFTAIELMPIASFPGNHNWGYDGVLPYAPEKSYGTPDELKALVDRAHELGIMMFLDVVYNHFGPDGNYLNSYAKSFFREDIHTPWGAAIDFRRPEVKEFFIQNAVYWLNEFHFDGLRFDALHAVTDQTWLPELTSEIGARVQHGRKVHLVMEHEDNASHLLPSCFEAQWNDDGHHVLHTLLTGESHGYYADYAEQPGVKLARCLEQGFVYQGEPSVHRKGEARGMPSAHLPPTAFILFLQNHDQIGNRALGERLTTLAEPESLRAAMALLLLSPQIPLMFMGEPAGSTEPFYYFTDYSDEKLAEAIREGRRAEFKAFAEFADSKKREQIPDPNEAETFAKSIPASIADEKLDRERQEWLGWTQRLLRIRHEHIIPRLAGCSAAGASALSSHAVSAQWRMGDGSILVIVANFSKNPISHEPDPAWSDGQLLFETPGAADALVRGSLPGQALHALLVPPQAGA